MVTLPTRSLKLFAYFGVILPNFVGVYWANLGQIARIFKLSIWLLIYFTIKQEDYQEKQILSVTTFPSGDQDPHMTPPRTTTAAALRGGTNGRPGAPQALLPAPRCSSASQPGLPLTSFSRWQPSLHLTSAPGAAVRLSQVS